MQEDCSLLNAGYAAIQYLSVYDKIVRRDKMQECSFSLVPYRGQRGE